MQNLSASASLESLDANRKQSEQRYSQMNIKKTNNPGVGTMNLLNKHKMNTLNNSPGQRVEMPYQDKLLT